MSIGKCLANEFPGRRLGVVGFLSDEGAAIYQHLSGLSFNYLLAEETRELLSGNKPEVAVNRESLHATLCADVSILQSRHLWVNCLAIATPGLELLSAAEITALGLEYFSQAEILTEYCQQHELLFVGLLGTEWDVDDAGPLVQALGAHRVQVWTPESEVRPLLSICAQKALRGEVQFGRRTFAADEFCAEVVDQMIHAACGMMNALVICNPELRPLIRLFKSKRKQFFTTTPIIDLTNLYWQKLTQAISRRQKDPPS